MKKSKFLKKSLAMLLALMLVVAMIPLSASAKPSDTFKPAADAGLSAEVTKTDTGWNMVFDYTATPKVVFETSGSGETVQYVDENGETQDYSTAISLWEKDGKPAPLTIKVTNGGETTEHVITWSVKNAASEVSVKEAKIGDIKADKIDEANRTIHFTLPFGYVEKNGVNATSDVTATITMNGVKTAPGAVVLYDNGASKNYVETNANKGQAVEFTVRPQNDSKDIIYKVIAEEETGLTAIKIGDYEGVFVKDPTPSSANYGYETGTIQFTVPADVQAASFNKVAISYTIASNFTEVLYDTSTKVVSGNEYDFSGLVSGTKTLTIKNADGERAYTLEFVKDGKDTTITGLSITDSGKVYTGTVDGENLSIVVPADKAVNSLTVDFVGPKNNGTAPSIEVATDSLKTADFNTDGKAQLTTLDCTNPVRLKVTSADDSTYKYYTLTVTKAESENNDPKITSAKMVVDKGLDTQAEYTASISGSVITFNVPYSLTDAQIAAAEFTFAKTAQTTLGTLTKGTLKDGGSVSAISNDNATTVNYKITYKRADALTGKTISNFVLSQATNKNEMDFNNNKNFNVTVSGDEFKVSLPTTFNTLYPDFTLSEGAKLYTVADTGSNGVDDEQTFTEVKAYKTTDGENQGSTINPKATATTVYFVADEYLATAIANNELASKTYDQLKNAYEDHFTEYSFNVTTTDRKESRLLSISADDGKVTGSFDDDNGTEITLTVPYSYAKNSTAFFLDFEVTNGARFAVKSDSFYNILPGGLKDYNGTKIVNVNKASDKTLTDPSFLVKKSGTEYKLYWNYGDGIDATKDLLYVFAENAVVSGNTLPVDTTTYTPYTVKIKVADPETGNSITSLKANNVSAIISGNTITANLPFGTNLGQVKLAITASEMAEVKVGNAVFNADDTYDLTSPLKITVTSETGDIKVYTLTAKNAEQFSDVQPGDWYYDNVMAAVEAGIVSGMGDGTFKPMGNITRRDFATMVTKLLLNGEEPPKAETTPFSDVSSNDYALNAIAYCAENGIISGSNGEFRPGDYITRQEAASIMKNALELTGTTSDLFADDAKIADWAKANVYACKAGGIFKGDEKNNFNPTNPITRAEAASIMVNALNK